MSLWGLVSSLSDSGKAFIASTARDLADFKHALQDETRDFHVAAASSDSATTGATPDPAAAASTATAAAAAGRSVKASLADSSAAAVDGGGGAGSGSDASPAQRDNSAPLSSRSSLTSNIERLGGRMLHMLPAVFRQPDSEHASSAVTDAALPSTARDGSHGSSASVSGGGFDQRLLAVLRDRRTYASDPIDPLTGQPSAAYSSFAASFQAECSQRSEAELQRDWAALRANHPSIRHWYEQIVDTGQADAPTFWCRYQYARHSLQEDERRRQKLADRLAGIKAAAATTLIQQRQHTQQTGQDDTLQWDEDDEESVGEEAMHQQQRSLQHQQPRQQQRRPSKHCGRDSECADLPLTSPLEQLSQALPDALQPPTERCTAAAAEAATKQAWQARTDSDSTTGGEGEDASGSERAAAPSSHNSSAPSYDSDDGDGELLALSPSPVSSEGSGELIDPQEAVLLSLAAIDSSRDAAEDGVERRAAAASSEHQPRHSGSDRVRQPAAAERHSDTRTETATAAEMDVEDSRGHGSDYDDWE